MIGEYPKTGQKFKVLDDVYKWVPYHPSVRHIYGEGRFQKRVWNKDFFKWKNIDPPKDMHWDLIRTTIGKDRVKRETT